MKILKDIINQMGSVTSEQLKEVSRDYGKIPLVIKWAYAPRQQFLASQIIQKIEEGDPNDYVREVFMTSRTLKYVTEQINKLESCPR